MFHRHVASVCSKCFIYFRRTLQVCLSGCLHMLQWLYTSIASVYSKCFICFRRMLQVLSGCCIMQIRICCKRILQMFHLFSDVCCRSASCRNIITSRFPRTQALVCVRSEVGVCDPDLHAQEQAQDAQQHAGAGVQV